uniref:hypothetical protein n=1 Tax=Halobacteriovorax sp. TaxID=2020862 RepID=UPI003562E468
MQKIIQSIFQTLIITIGLQAQAGDLFNFSINYNSDSNTSNYIDNYNEQEESRVANYYNVNDITIDSLGSTNQQIGHIFEDLANDAHINSRDLPAIISQLGSNYTPQEQQNFISTIQRLSGKNESQSIVQVAPHLSDIKPTFLSKEENLLFNTARLKISNSMSKAITNCKKEKCSLSSLHVSKNLLNKVINSSLNNTINTSHLNRWGEDTSFTQESEESIKRFIENIDKKNLNQAIKEL